MQRCGVARILVIVGILAVVALPCTPYVWAEEGLRDCRDKPCTANDFLNALDPRPKGIPKPGMALTPPTPAPAALDIRFGTNSAQIDPKYHAHLNELGQALTKLHAPVEIAGYTDSRGSDRLNETLSQQRAESVKQYLVTRFSLPENRLVAKGYGKRKPIAPNETSEGREKNRRVEVARTGQ